VQCTIALLCAVGETEAPLCACANIATSLDECVCDRVCVFLRSQIVSMQVGCRPVSGRGPMSKALSSSRRVFVQGSCAASLVALLSLSSSSFSIDEREREHGD
jgi:hypothetical protein